MKTAQATLPGKSVLRSLAEATSSALSNFAEPRPDKLQEHIHATYVHLRWGIIVIAILFPLALWVLGVIWGPIKLQTSLSAYYHAGEPGNRLPRDVFVGVLFLVGGFLYLYKGYSRRENWLLNIAGVCAWGVALFPTDWKGKEPFDFPYHVTFAIAFFACIALVAIFCAMDSVKDIENEKGRIERLRNTYRVIGVLMIGAPLVVVWLVRGLGYRGFWTIAVECIGIWVFSAYWIVKSIELSATQAERTRMGLAPQQPPAIAQGIGKLVGIMPLPEAVTAKDTASHRQ
jgi:hypothetical protein